ncbi:MAG: acyl-CoA dehydrogenase family protein [Planctomycetes bacterium]|nr:acyl-CoA dehydrogenase family protein [Planctomycetota bacterium]
MEPSPLDSLLTEEQTMIAQAVGEFATDVVMPRHEALDHAGTHPEDLWNELAELGLFGVAVPDELGGAGAGCVGQVIVIEKLSRAAGAVGRVGVRPRNRHRCDRRFWRRSGAGPMARKPGVGGCPRRSRPRGGGLGRRLHRRGGRFGGDPPWAQDRRAVPGTGRLLPGARAAWRRGGPRDGGR